MPSGRTNNFPWKWAWPRSRDPYNFFCIRSNISLKVLELETSNLIHGFVWGMPSTRTNKFPWKWAWPGSRDPYNFWQYTVGYPSDSLASCLHSYRITLFTFRIAAISTWRIIISANVIGAQAYDMTETTSKQRSRSFILVGLPIRFHNDLYRLYQ